MCFRILMLSTCPVALSYVVVTVKWLPMRCTVSPPVSAHYAGEVLTGQLSQLSKTQDHVHPARDSHLGAETVSTRTPSTMCFCKREPAWFSHIWYTFESCTWWQSTCIFASEARTCSLQFSRLDLYFSNHCTIHVHMLQLLFRFKAWASNWRTLGKCTRTSVKSTFLKAISVGPIEWRIKWAFCSSCQFDQDVKGQLEPMQQEYLRRRTPAACVLKLNSLSRHETVDVWEGLVPFLLFSLPVCPAHLTFSMVALVALVALERRKSRLDECRFLEAQCRRLDVPPACSRLFAWTCSFKTSKELLS